MATIVGSLDERIVKPRPLISVTVLSLWFATQTWVPSEETREGTAATAMVWTTAPVEASSSVTVLSP